MRDRLFALLDEYLGRTLDDSGAARLRDLFDTQQKELLTQEEAQAGHDAIWATEVFARAVAIYAPDSPLKRCFAKLRRLASQGVSPAPPKETE